MVLVSRMILLVLTSTGAAVEVVQLMLMDMQVMAVSAVAEGDLHNPCLLYTSPSPRDATLSRMPSSA